MTTENLDLKAAKFNRLTKALEDAREDVKKDSENHQKHVASFKEKKTRENSIAVTGSKFKLDASERRQANAFQALQKFRANNAGSVGKIEKRAAELRGDS